MINEPMKTQWYLWCHGDCDFEDVAMYFSWEEWSLLDMAQRCLHHSVMLENLALITFLGCWCGVEDKAASSQQCISARVLSPGRTSQAGMSPQKVCLCEICGPILRDILPLVEHQETHPEQKLHMGHVDDFLPLQTFISTISSRSEINSSGAI